MILTTRVYYVENKRENYVDKLLSTCTKRKEVKVKGVIKDKEGKYPFPTIEAGKGEQHTLFDIN